MPEMDELTSMLKAAGLSEVPKYHDTYPELNPVDIYRSHITELLAPIAGVEPKAIHSALSWTATLDKGDLLLPVPALRVKGKKPKEFAEELQDKVCTFTNFYFYFSKKKKLCSQNISLTDNTGMGTVPRLTASRET